MTETNEKREPVHQLDLAKIPAELIEALEPVAPASLDEIQAVRRLIRVAKTDTGQGRMVADFLLAWWNPGSCGSFDMTILWGVDASLARDMVKVFGLVARVHEYPDKIHPAFESDFADIIRCWRPELHLVPGVGRDRRDNERQEGGA